MITIFIIVTPLNKVTCMCGVIVDGVSIGEWIY
jgi:hypothetical protein